MCVTELWFRGSRWQAWGARPALESGSRVHRGLPLQLDTFHRYINTTATHWSSRTKDVSVVVKMDKTFVSQTKELNWRRTLQFSGGKCSQNHWSLYGSIQMYLFWHYSSNKANTCNTNANKDSKNNSVNADSAAWIHMQSKWIHRFSSIANSKPSSATSHAVMQKP